MSGCLLVTSGQRYYHAPTLVLADRVAERLRMLYGHARIVSAADAPYVLASMRETYGTLIECRVSEEDCYLMVSDWAVQL